jgi:DNA excision repair protein ERCC-4
MMIVIDTREQLPLDFGSEPVQRGTLASGDYSVVGMETVIAVERKSLADLVMSVSRERDRFWREIARLAQMPMAAVVVEASFASALAGRYRAKVHPNALIASCIAIQIDFGIPVMWMWNRELAASWTLAFLRLGFKRFGEGGMPGAVW